MDDDKKPFLNIPEIILILFLAFVTVFTLVMGYHALSRNHANQGDVKAGFEKTKIKHGVTKEY